MEQRQTMRHETIVKELQTMREELIATESIKPRS